MAPVSLQITFNLFTDPSHDEAIIQRMKGELVILKVGGKAAETCTDSSKRFQNIISGKCWESSLITYLNPSP